MATVDAIRWQYLTLQKDLWGKLGPQKWLVGRDFVNDATKLLVLNWPYRTALVPSKQGDTLKDLEDFALTRMATYRGRRKRYGFIWTLLLSAVLGQLIRLLLDWWLADESNKSAIEFMRVLREAKDAGTL